MNEAGGDDKVDGRGVPPYRTASGLDEGQIDPQDLQKLHDAVVLHTLELEGSTRTSTRGGRRPYRWRGRPCPRFLWDGGHGGPPHQGLPGQSAGAEACGYADEKSRGLSQFTVKELDLELAAGRLLRLRVASLPNKTRIRRLVVGGEKLRLADGLAVALERPLRRGRIFPGDLGPAAQKALNQALHDKFGDKAAAMEVTALFPNIPPEAVGGITVDPSLSFATFVLPRDAPPRQARSGFHLVVLQEGSDRTRMMLFRLDK
ncbi:hypothetical protein IIA79_04915 [bacterium]|nr:hypothetical protein [bacterium]